MRCCCRQIAAVCAAHARVQFGAVVVACSPGLAVFGTKLYAVGGYNFDQGGYLSSVETLDSADGSTWVTETSGLNVARA